MYPYFHSPSSIFQRMDRLQREMNRVFDQALEGRSNLAAYPAVNIYAAENVLVLHAELPGFQAENLDISINGETLTLSGERFADNVPEEAQYHRQERGVGKFSRTIKLPYTIEADQVQAELKNGLLTLTLPRAKADLPRKIAVNH